MSSRFEAFVGSSEWVNQVRGQMWFEARRRRGEKAKRGGARKTRDKSTSPPSSGPPRRPLRPFSPAIRGRLQGPPAFLGRRDESVGTTVSFRTPSRVETKLIYTPSPSSPSSLLFFHQFPLLPGRHFRPASLSISTTDIRRVLGSLKLKPFVD